jgi:hypothetical protein
MTRMVKRWISDVVLRAPNLIAVVGDSHSLFCFSEIDEARVFWRGPVLMHRVGRDGVTSILPPRFPTRRFKGIIFMFGEIDCRIHVQVIAARQSAPVEAVIDDLVTRYIAAIVKFREIFSGQVAVSCVIPPAALTLPVGLDETVAEASQQQVRIRRRLNRRLSDLATENGIAFIDFYDEFATATGDLDVTLSDGGVHLDPKRSQPILNATAASLGRALTHRPLDRDIFLLAAGNYWRRQRQLLDRRLKGRPI